MLRRIAKTVTEPALPEHWRRRKDEQGADFYWNSVTMTSSYERPQFLPAGWRERRDPATSVIYHYNVYPRETRWPPASKGMPSPPMQPPQGGASASGSDTAHGSEGSPARERAVLRWRQAVAAIVADNGGGGVDSRWWLDSSSHLVRQHALSDSLHSVPPPGPPPLGPPLPGTLSQAVLRRPGAAPSALPIGLLPPGPPPGQPPPPPPPPSGDWPRRVRLEPGSFESNPAAVPASSGQAVGMEVRSSVEALPRLALSLRLDPLSGLPMLTWLEGEHAGVAVGDLLLSVNGQRPATVEAAETLLLKASRSGMPIDLELCAAPRGTEAETQPGRDSPLASLDGREGEGEHSTSASPDRSSPWLRSRRRSSIGLGEQTTGYL